MNTRSNYSTAELARDIAAGVADAVGYRRMGRPGLRRSAVRVAWHDRAALRARGITRWWAWAA